MVLLLTGCETYNQKSDIHGCYAQSGGVLVNGELGDMTNNAGFGDVQDCCCTNNDVRSFVCICDDPKLIEKELFGN